jgi:hypothetical protein
MVQFLIALAFCAILIGAARSIAYDLMRPRTLYPACWDDALLDALCDGRVAPNRLAAVRARPAMVRPVSRRPAPSRPAPSCPAPRLLLVEAA